MLIVEVTLIIIYILGYIRILTGRMEGGYLLYPPAAPGVNWVGHLVGTLYIVTGCPTSNFLLLPTKNKQNIQQILKSFQTFFFYWHGVNIRSDRNLDKRKEIQEKKVGKPAVDPLRFLSFLNI